MVICGKFHADCFCGLKGKVRNESMQNVAKMNIYQILAIKPWFCAPGLRPARKLAADLLGSWSQAGQRNGIWLLPNRLKIIIAVTAAMSLITLSKLHYYILRYSYARNGKQWHV